MPPGIICIGGEDWGAGDSFLEQARKNPVEETTANNNKANRFSVVIRSLSMNI
jgi:hypothetical protein